MFRTGQTVPARPSCKQGRKENPPGVGKPGGRGKPQGLAPAGSEAASRLCLDESAAMVPLRVLTPVSCTFNYKQL